MKYQEQTNGVAQKILSEAPPEQTQQPSVVEMAMSQAAQQVMSANQKMQQAQSPEQQLVALEQQKVQLEQQKLQSNTAIHAAEMELKNKKLELEENEQVLDILKTNSTDNIEKEKIEGDRASKKELKVMDILAKLGMEEDKLTSADTRERERILKEIFKDREKSNKDKEMVGLNTLAKMAMEQSKKEKINDEEG